MTGQDVIRFLFLLNLQYRKYKQVIPAPTAPTSPRTLLPKQLYNVSNKSDVPFVTFPCVQQQQLVMPAPTGPRILLAKQLYYDSSKSNVPFVTFPCVQQQQLVIPAPTSPRILLSKQLYYDRTRCDSHSASCPIS